MASVRSPVNVNRPHDLRPVREGGLESDAAVFMRLTLGAVLITQFVANVQGGSYGQGRYARLIHRYIETAQAPAFWKSVERFVADHAAIFSILQAVAELGLGVLLVVGIARAPVALGAFALLFLLWLSELGLNWTWELPPLVLAAAAVFLANARSWRAARFPARLLGPPVFGLARGVVVALGASALLAGILAAHRDPGVVVVGATALYLASLIASAILDARLRHTQTQ